MDNLRDYESHVITRNIVVCLMASRWATWLNLMRLFASTAKLPRLPPLGTYDCSCGSKMSHVSIDYHSQLSSAVVSMLCARFLAELSGGRLGYVRELLKLDIDCEAE